MSLPTFHNAPIDEVVCGVQFASERGLRSVDLGMFWASVSKEFPTAEDHPPVIEQLPPTIELTNMSMPLLRRVWLHSTDGTRLLQLQENMLFYNWRKRNEDQSYPRYEIVVQEFLAQWENFVKWAATGWPGAIRPKRFQLAYVNHITPANGWEGPDDTSKILKYMSKLDGKVFETLEYFNSDLRVKLPSGLGILTVTSKHGHKIVNQLPVPVLVIELNVQSGDTVSLETKAWFDGARDAIVNGFVEITTQDAHKRWMLNS